MTKLNRIWIISALLYLLPSILSSQSKPFIQQNSDRSLCSNIIALTGSVNLNCSSLTAEQSRALLQIRDMLRRMISDKIDPDLIKQMSDKLDEIKLMSSRPSQIVSAPNGIGSIGGTLINPQVNNYGPPPATLTHTEEMLPTQLKDGRMMKQMRIHIHTDKAISGARIGVLLSGPFDTSAEFYTSHNPSLSTGTYQIDRDYLAVNGVPTLNGFSLFISIPAAFNPNVDLIVPVQSNNDIQVLQVVQIMN